MTTAIVVEGGGMRGVFSAGVLDVFAEQNFFPFDLAIGCSAGSCNLSSYLSGQIGRAYRSYLKFMLRPGAISRSRFLLGGHLLNLDQVWDELASEEPLSIDSVLRHRTQLMIALTDVEHGSAVIMEAGEACLLDSLKASCALPIFYRNGVSLNGRQFVDGGVTSPIPVKEAIERGAKKVLVIRSRPRGHKLSNNWEAVIGSRLTRATPALSRAILESNNHYRGALGLIEKPPLDCKVLDIAPRIPLRSSRTSRNLRDLDADYSSGRVAGFQAIKDWSANF